MTTISREELQAAWLQVKSMDVLPQMPQPKMPIFNAKTPLKQRLKGIQNFITAHEYNYTGEIYFDVNKNRSFKSIVSTAKEILAEPLPIQCLEAVFLAAYLTATWTDLDRFPISFKSYSGTATYRHIILAVRHNNIWGALGLSRNENLMYKDLKFSSLSSLLKDYISNFTAIYHTVTKIYMGFPFSHDIHSAEKVEWRVLNIPIAEGSSLKPLSPSKNPWVHFDNFSKDAMDLLAYKNIQGILPDSFSIKYPLSMTDTESGSSRSPDRKSALLALDSDVFFEEDTAAQSKTESTPGWNNNCEKQIPILITPKEVVFKPSQDINLCSSAHNIFLSNTTSVAYKIDVLAPSGEIEIVTKGARISSKTFNPADDHLSDIKSVQNRSKQQMGSKVLQDQLPLVTYYLAPKGMLVMAIRLSHPSYSKLIEASKAGEKAMPEDKIIQNKSQESKGHSRNTTPRLNIQPVSIRNVHFHCTPIAATSFKENSKLCDDIELNIPETMILTLPYIC